MTSFEPPRVGQRWIDTRFSLLTNGHKHVLTIMAVWPTITGVKCSVRRHEVDECDRAVSDYSSGVIFVDHLHEWCQLLEDARA